MWGVDLLASPSTGAMCCGHALTCMPLCYEGGRHVRLDFCSEGVMWHSCCHPRCCWSMDVVMVEWFESYRVRAWFSCSYWLCTVTSIMSMGASTTVGGPRGTTSCLRVPRAPRARWKHTTGGRALLMMSQGLGQGGEMSPETPIVSEASRKSRAK
jgi:hypothetical protein